MQAAGKLEELILLDGKPAARIVCPPPLIPQPGRYLLGSVRGSNAALAVPLFSAHANADGFLAAPPLPEAWTPGAQLLLRGPLGHGFDLPEGARRVGVMAFDDTLRCLLPLAEGALKQDALVTLMSDNPPEDLPLSIEFQPLNALEEICHWADYLAVGLLRESLPQLKRRLANINTLTTRFEPARIIQLNAQALFRTALPCGGLAQCGVCGVETGRGQRLTCEEGPVFDVKDLL